MIASLQNSVPLQATVPRAKADPPTCEADRVEFFRQRVGVDRGHVHDQQVLHVGGAQFAAGKALGEIGGGLHLVGSDSSPQSDRSDIRETRLLLRVNADVVAVDVVRRMLFDRRDRAWNPMRSCSSPRKRSAVHPWRRKRNFRRARSRCSRSTSESRNSSAIPLITGTTWFQRTKAFSRAPR